MLVRDLMTKGVVTIGMDATLEDARRLMTERGFHHLLVTEAGRVVGVISDRDILRTMSPFVGKMAERTQDVALLERKAHQFMTRQPKTIGPDAPVAEAAGVMRTGRVSCLPVCRDDGSLAGILTSRDLLELTADLLSKPPAGPEPATEAATEAA